MDKAWIEQFAKYGPWAILAFLILYGVYKLATPILGKVLDHWQRALESSQEYMKNNAEGQRAMLADQLKRVEDARREEQERNVQSSIRRDEQAARLHIEQIAFNQRQVEAMAALAAEVRSFSERLPRRNNKGHDE